MVLTACDGLHRASVSFQDHVITSTFQDKNEVPHLSIFFQISLTSTRRINSRKFAALAHLVSDPDAHMTPLSVDLPPRSITISPPPLIPESGVSDLIGSALPSHQTD
jgi:hypothetical protein